LRLLVSETPEWQPAGVSGDRSVHAGARRIVCPTAALVTVKCPEHVTPFWSQNCGFATEAVPGAEYSCSSGARSSLETKLPLASEV